MKRLLTQRVGICSKEKGGGVVLLRDSHMKWLLFWLVARLVSCLQHVVLFYSTLRRVFVRGYIVDWGGGRPVRSQTSLLGTREVVNAIYIAASQKMHSTFGVLQNPYVSACDVTTCSSALVVFVSILCSLMCAT